MPEAENLAAEAVEGAVLALEGVHDVHGGHGLAAGVLGVGHGVADHVLEEDLEDRAGLLVDEARDTLHTTTASETADGGLGDALDVVAKHLAVTLRAALAETLAALATSGHCFCLRCRLRDRRSRFEAAKFARVGTISRLPYIKTERPSRLWRSRPF